MLLEVVTVIVVEPEVLTVVGEKLAPAPLGRPVTPKLTVPLKPLSAPIVTIYAALDPGFTACELGEAMMEKSGVAAGGLTVSVTGVECCRLPLVPVIVTV